MCKCLVRSRPRGRQLGQLRDHREVIRVCIREHAELSGDEGCDKRCKAVSVLWTHNHRLARAWRPFNEAARTLCAGCVVAQQ